MNGFKHVETPGIVGGHWWDFNKSKYMKILAAVDGDLDHAKRLAYGLKNKTWPFDAADIEATSET